MIISEGKKISTSTFYPPSTVRSLFVICTNLIIFHSLPPPCFIQRRLSYLFCVFDPNKMFFNNLYLSVRNSDHIQYLHSFYTAMLNARAFRHSLHCQWSKKFFRLFSISLSSSLSKTDYNVDEDGVLMKNVHNNEVFLSHHRISLPRRPYNHDVSLRGTNELNCFIDSRQQIIFHCCPLRTWSHSFRRVFLSHFSSSTRFSFS